MIAMAVACSPDLLIADEPTTSLDVTIQAQILDLLLELKQDLDTAIIIITHDLGVIAEVAEKVVVMYAGTVVETGPVKAIFSRPQHPYTQALLFSIPPLHHRQTPGHHIGRPTSDPGPPDSLPFRAALPAAHRQVHGGAPPSARRDREPRVCLLGGSGPQRSLIWPKQCYRQSA